MPASRTISPSDSHGFTLVELLMAMLVMTVGLLGLLQSVMVAYEHNIRNRLREEALLVGEEQMNGLRGRVQDTSTPFLTTTTAVKVILGANKKFFVTREYLPIGVTVDQPMGSADRLKVTVGWSFKNVSSTHVTYTLKSR